jgi:hypothetical protein
MNNLLFTCSNNPRCVDNNFPCYDCFEITHYKVSDTPFILHQEEVVIQLFRAINPFHLVLIREVLNTTNLEPNNKKVMEINSLMSLKLNL